VSFDVYFQRFQDGRAVPGGGEEMRRVLEPYVAREDPAHSFAFVEYGDGSADVYLGSDDMMVTHVVGEKPWELLVEGARAAGWVVMPADGPTCITDETQRAHLSDDLSGDVVAIETGLDLLRVIRAL
jgi:ketosteroid isomerase-like protein